MFWTLASIILLFALAWPLARLFKPAADDGTSAKSINLNIYRDRLDELRQDVLRGAMLPEQFDEAREELAAALLQDIKTTQTPVTTSPRRNLYLVIAIAALGTIAITAVTYTYLRGQILFQNVEPGSNNPEAVAAYQALPALIQQLRSDTGNPQLWEKLGQQYQQMERPDAANYAFAKALTYGGESADLFLSQAQILSLKQQGALEGEPAELIERARLLEPDNPRAMIWSGLVAIQRGDYDRAISLWERVRNALAPDSTQYANINALIGQAQQKKAQAGTAMPGTQQLPPDHPPTSASASTASVEVTVSVSPKLAKLARPDTPVYIFARAVDGPSMPLAVLQKTMSDLPLSIVLDDSGAMTEQARLSQFKAVKIIARVSLSGDVMAQPGDLFGEAGPVDPHSAPRLALTINQQVPGKAAATSAPVTPPAAATGAASIQVKISLDPALVKQANPDDTLFVFARAANGPPMPLAAVRKQVRDLPLNITLDDSSAMSPQLRLSQHDQVKIVARISRSGTPAAQSGDLFGEAGPVDPKNTKPLNIVIKSKVP